MSNFQLYNLHLKTTCAESPSLWSHVPLFGYSNGPVDHLSWQNATFPDLFVENSSYYAYRTRAASAGDPRPSPSLSSRDFSYTIPNGVGPLSFSLALRFRLNCSQFEPPSNSSQDNLPLLEIWSYSPSNSRVPLFSLYHSSSTQLLGLQMLDQSTGQYSNFTLLDNGSFPRFPVTDYSLCLDYRTLALYYVGVDPFLTFQIEIDSITTLLTVPMLNATASTTLRLVYGEQLLPSAAPHPGNATRQKFLQHDLSALVATFGASDGTRDVTVSPALNVADRFTRIYHI